MNKKKVIALVDCNNFYASCEKVFNPKLKNKPVVVLSNNDGCIIARSAEAKALGIKMGEPFFKVEDFLKAKGVHVLSTNFPLYGDMSRRVMQSLSTFVPDIEIYSIDEAFIDFTAFQGDVTEYSREIRQKIKQWTGIEVSIGIAETKTLAKLANNIAKKSQKTNGVLNLVASPHLDKALEITDVGAIWGIGKRSKIKLNHYGVTTALDLKNTDRIWIKQQMGIVGQRIVRELGGDACISIDLNPPPKQGITTSRTFGKTVESLEELQEAVSLYVSKAAEKLRKEKLAAGILSVNILKNRFMEEDYYNSRLIKLAAPTISTPLLIKEAVKAVEEMYEKGSRYKKAGVHLSGLVPEDEVQRNFFDNDNKERSKKLMTAIDKINREIGDGSVRFAAEGYGKAWKMKQERRSKSYTTKWDELVEAIINT